MKYRSNIITAAAMMFFATSCDKPIEIETVSTQSTQNNVEALTDNDSAQDKKPQPNQEVSPTDDMNQETSQTTTQPAQSATDVLKLNWIITTPNAEFRITNENALPFDVDCDGDGTFEQTNITEHYTCVFTAPGSYQTTIQGPLAQHLTNTPKIATTNPKGTTLETRFPAPNGYYRITQTDPGYANYLHALPMLPDGSPVLLYYGAPKDYQDGHVAVIDIDVGDRDLQQCADAAMRLRTEYLFATDQHEKMVYHLANGLKFSWPEWRSGSRLVKDDKGKLVMSKTGSVNKSYKNYRSWLDKLMMYANVDSVMRESQKLTLDDIAPGDIFASRGKAYNHLIIAIDVVTAPDGTKQFLLAQSYMPAQQIEVLKNPYHSDTPWYSIEEVKQLYAEDKSFLTPEWDFPAPGPNLYRMN